MTPQICRRARAVRPDLEYMTDEELGKFWVYCREKGLDFTTAKPPKDRPVLRLVSNK